ncbi:MAG: cell division protein FtsH, partial [Mariprofundus sp.]
DDQKETTAYHEAGHTLVAKHLKNADPVHKVSIIPRGQALGITMQMPEEDRFNHDKEYLRDQIAIMMGGRLGEELVLGQMTTGASNDFERATQLARNMVTQWGMSDELGPMVYGEREHEPFLGREITRQTNISEETARKIDAVVRTTIEENYERAKSILEENMDQLHLLSKALMKYETLDTSDIDRAMEGKEPLLMKETEQASSEKTPPEEPSTKVDVGSDGDESNASGDEAGLHS